MKSEFMKALSSAEHMPDDKGGYVWRGHNSTKQEAVGVVWKHPRKKYFAIALN